MCALVVLLSVLMNFPRFQIQLAIYSVAIPIIKVVNYFWMDEAKSRAILLNKKCLHKCQLVMQIMFHFNINHVPKQNIANHFSDYFYFETYFEKK